MQNILNLRQIEQYCNDMRENERESATIQKYRHTLLTFYAWLPAEKTVAKETVRLYKSELTDQRAPAGVNTVLAALNGFFRYIGWEECRVKLLRIQRRVFAAQEKELSHRDYKRLVTAAKRRKNERLALLLQLMAATGMRVSEIAYITRERAFAGKIEISLKGKVRTILLPGKLRRALLQYAKQQKIKSGALFRTRTGRPLNRKEIWAQMKRLCTHAEVDPQKVFPHNLRHLFARTFYQAQKDIAKLADLLGHSSVETTRIYLLSSGKEHLAALNQLNLIC